jgi:hypothetical protein
LLASLVPGIALTSAAALLVIVPIFMISIGVFGKLLTLSIVAGAVACVIVFTPGSVSVETEFKELSA